MNFINHTEDLCLFLEEKTAYTDLLPEHDPVRMLLSIASSSFGTGHGKCIYGIDEREDEDEEWEYR